MSSQTAESASTHTPGTASEAAPTRTCSVVTWSEMFSVWTRVAVLSFGGPAGQISVMHRILVDERKWISEDRFLHALSYCMLLPGPEAQQLATYSGWLLHGVRGGLLAGGLFILPGFLVIMLLSMIYAQFNETVLVAALFFGMKPAVMAIICDAVIRIGRRVLKNSTMIAMAAISFVMIFLLDAPFPLLIVAAAITGAMGQRYFPEWFVQTAEKTTTSTSSVLPRETALFVKADEGPGRKTDLRRATLVLAVCLTIWFVPLLIIRSVCGAESVFWKEAVFFSKTAVVTFGGAYAVLAYIAQQAVENFGWLRPGEMMDGLGMAETTPGPLIMVVQFVGFMGAFRNHGEIWPMAAGILGAVITTWVTFVPCFLWIFLGAPHVEGLRGNRLLNAMLTSITAAVVGVILNLAVWFAVHTLFGDVAAVRIGLLRLLLPEAASLDIAALLIAVVGFVLTFWYRRGMGITLAVCCATGLVITLWRSL